MTRGVRLVCWLPSDRPNNSLLDFEPPLFESENQEQPHVGASKNRDIRGAIERRLPVAGCGRRRILAAAEVSSISNL